MYIKKFSIFIVLVLILSSVKFTAYAQDVLNINNLNDFLAFANSVNSGNDFAGRVIRLNNNINMNGAVWVPIGTESTPFNGKFDGNGCAVLNLSLPLYSGEGENIKQYKYVGLFGYVGGSGEIENITVNCVNDLSVKVANDSRIYYGNLAGYSEGNIEGCTTTGSIAVKHTQSMGYFGGVCGYNKGAIADSNYIGSSAGSPYNLIIEGRDDYKDLYSDSCVGGICGSNHGLIVNCETTCSINATNAFASCSAGGIAGDNKGEITDCSSNTYIKGRGLFAISSGYVYVGGICGSNNGTLSYSNSTSKILACIEPGENNGRSVTGDGGGVCGYNNGQITACYASGGFEISGSTDYNLSAITNVGGLCGYNSGSISDSFADGGTINSTLNTAGGLCGYNKSGDINNCYVENTTVNATVTVTRTKYCGGIVGVNEAGYIFMSYSKAQISAANNPLIYGGGICGFNDSGNIDSCYFLGSAVSAGVAGGMCGKNRGTLYCSYVNTTITSAVGNAIAGENSGICYECYYADTMSADNGIGIPKSIDELRMASTYQKWNFNDIWEIDETNSGYPHFKDDVSIDFEFGNGTEDSPYLIYTESDLKKIRYTNGAYFRLASDISLSDAWVPIGSNDNPYSGFFDGNGFTISELNIPESSGSAFSGLFGYCNNLSIKNLCVKTSADGEIWADASSFDLSGKAYSGGIVGFAANGIIENCNFQGTVIADGATAYAGGIVGYQSGSVNGCISSGVVQTISEGIIGNAYCGGIAGCVEGIISESSSACNVLCESSTDVPFVKSGGIVGNMIGEIMFCSSSSGDIIMPDSNYNILYCGGIAGNIDGDISFSYSDRVINSGNPKGGAAGGLYNGSWQNLFFNDLSFDNDIGIATEQEDMQGSEFLDLLGDGERYIWVSSVGGRIVPLQIKVDREYEDGVMKMSLAANGYADIYYTLDGSDPRENGILYQQSFYCFDSETIKYCAKTSDNRVSGVFEIANDYGFNAEGDLIYFLGKPINEADNSLITSDNIANAEEISVILKSTFASDDIDDIIVYLSAYNADGALLAVDTVKTSVIIGNNKVIFNKIQDMKDNAVKWKIFVWDKNIKPKSNRALEI